MDLLSSESKKTGTRGGRGNFTWDSVQDKDRHYYLGNSVAKPITRQYGSTANQDPLWYTRRNESNEIIAPENKDEIIEGENANDMNICQERRSIRRRERKIMENVVVGRSFSDAVRCALTESVASSVDDEGSRGDAEEIQQTKTIRRQEKNEKAERKEMRKRIREQRRLRRAERNRVRLGKEEAVDAINRSSESERESLRQNRLQDDGGKRRRRRERDCAIRRKRSDFCSSSDSDDSDSHRTRRQRLR